METPTTPSNPDNVDLDKLAALPISAGSLFPLGKPWTGKPLTADDLCRKKAVDTQTGQRCSSNWLFTMADFLIPVPIYSDPDSANALQKRNELFDKLTLALKTEFIKAELKAQPFYSGSLIPDGVTFVNDNEDNPLEKIASCLNIVAKENGLIP